MKHLIIIALIISLISCGTDESLNDDGTISLCTLDDHDNLSGIYDSSNYDDINSKLSGSYYHCKIDEDKIYYGMCNYETDESLWVEWDLIIIPKSQGFVKCGVYDRPQ